MAPAGRQLARATTQAQRQPIELTENEAEGDELIELLAGKYDKVRALPDGSIAAMSKLAYSTAVYLGVNQWGFSKRFVYATPEKACEVFDGLLGEGDEPEGYIVAGR